jgi:uncharacterized membrane protein
MFLSFFFMILFLFIYFIFAVLELTPRVLLARWALYHLSRTSSHILGCLTISETDKSFYINKGVR